MSESNSQQQADIHVQSRSSWLLKAVGAGIVIAVLAAALLLPGFQSPRHRARSPCTDNLHNIGLALHHYHHRYGSLPPAFTEDRTGAKMHSWRALILPYLGPLHEHSADWLKSRRYAFGFWQSFDVRARELTARKKAQQIRAVLAEYDFSEPWDGPHNRKLAVWPLDAFRCPNGDSDEGVDYLAVVGSVTAWPKGAGRSLDDFRDGTASTILIIEANGTGIRWSEPQDLHFDALDFAASDFRDLGIRGEHQDGTTVLFADSHVQWMSSDTTPRHLRALLTVDGQEHVSW